MRERIAEYRKLYSYHSNHSDEDDSSKSCVNNVRVGGDVWMARLIKFYYTQTSDDVHKRRVYRKTQKENFVTSFEEDMTVYSLSVLIQDREGFCSTVLTF